MAEGFNFVIANEDVSIRFSCPNHSHRISEIVRNLHINERENKGVAKKTCRFTITEGKGTFSFNGETQPGEDIRHEAVFFENTEYPIIVKGANGKELSDLSFCINDRLRSDEGPKSTITNDDGQLYGSFNFHNQVGLTDFTLVYKVKGSSHTRKLKFTTEVLSYKLDYRSDLRTIISDIENEYAMLSAAFLKDTYLSMRGKSGSSNQLIWWQIFNLHYSHPGLVCIAGQSLVA